MAAFAARQDDAQSAERQHDDQDIRAQAEQVKRQAGKVGADAADPVGRRTVAAALDDGIVARGMGKNRQRQQQRRQQQQKMAQSQKSTAMFRRFRLGFDCGYSHKFILDKGFGFSFERTAGKRHSYPKIPPEFFASAGSAPAAVKSSFSSRAAMR